MFQIVLAAGVPWGEAAWGGQPAQLPTTLRLASVAVAAFYGAIVPLTVLGREGYGGRDGSSTVFRWGTWFLAALMVLGALLNFASQSPGRTTCGGPTR